MLVLTIDMRGEWIGRALAAGASGALSKSLHPSALTTLIRESANGHLVHAPISLAPMSPPPPERPATTRA